MLAGPAVAAIVLALDYFAIFHVGRFLSPVMFGSVLFLLIPVGASLVLDRAIARREQWLTEGRCRYCGYRLFDLPRMEFCPECGKSPELDANERRIIDRYRNARLKKW